MFHKGALIGKIDGKVACRIGNSRFLTSEFRGERCEEPLASRPLERSVMHQLIQIDRFANSPTNRLMFAWPIAIPTIVRVKFCIGDPAQHSNRSDI